MQPITVYGIETLHFGNGSVLQECMQPITVYGIETPPVLLYDIRHKKCMQPIREST